MAGLAVAMRTPATRRSLRRRWLIVAAVALAAAAVLVVAGMARRADTRAAALQHDGTRAPATVVSVDNTPFGRARLADGPVEVSFEAAGQSRQATVDVGGAVDAYTAGQAVDVVYDPADPGRVELVGVPPQRRGVPVAPPLILGVLLAAMAAVAGRHAAQIAHVLRHEGWLFVRSRLARDARTAGLRQRARTLVIVDTPGGPLTVEPLGLSRVDPGFAPEVWIAGLGARTLVLATPGGGHVVGVRRRGPGPGPGSSTS